MRAKGRETVSIITEIVDYFEREHRQYKNRTGRKSMIVGAVLGAHETEQIACVSLVENGERGRQPDALAVHAQKPVGDRVERASPDARGSAALGRATNAIDHLLPRAPAEGEQEQPLGVDALLDEMRNPGNERPRFARARSGNDHERRPGVGYRR